MKNERFLAIEVKNNFLFGQYEVHFYVSGLIKLKTYSVGLLVPVSLYLVA